MAVLLWTAFAACAPLWSFNKRVSIFRERAGQLSGIMEGPYRQEQEVIVPRNFFLDKRIMSFFLLVRFLKLAPKHTIARTLFFILFPFHKQQWYIDFDIHGTPVKKKALSYIV